MASAFLRSVFVVFALAPVISPVRAVAQPVAPPEAAPAVRPRIGLALSGGGARGMAHIGVLKVLESLRVPVDCVAGTSMGSIVGGAFAAGTSAGTLERIVERVDWNEVFTDRPPRGEIAARRKADDYKGFFAPEFGVRGGTLLLPKGVVAGVSVESFLRGLTASVANVQDFRELPIPFKAVASDIETGQQVILDHGSLPLAMRASMAIPGAMAPVDIEGRLLVDGGIANNLPIEVARQTCGEVIIAVNIQTEPLKRKDITSALSIVGQLINFLGKENVDRQLASLRDRDVLIQPELGEITSSSFERSKDAIAIGEAAARAMAASLARYSLPASEYAALRARQTIERVASLGRFDAIRFEGLGRTNSAVLMQLIETRPGMVVTEQGLAGDLRRIYGRGDFESIDYRIAEDANERVLVIQAREKESGPDYMRFGMSLASDFNGSSYFNALASYRRTWLNSLGAEWLVEGQLGNNSYLFTEFMQPLRGNGAQFIAPYAALGKAYRYLYSGDDRFLQYSVREARAGVDLGTTLGQWGELRIGPVWRKLRGEVEIGFPLPAESANASGVRWRLFGDRLDTPWFPRDGHRFTISGLSTFAGMGADDKYTRAELNYMQAVTTGSHTLVGSIYGGTDFGTGLPLYDALLLGGPFRLSGYSINEFQGREAVFGSLRYHNRIKSLPNPLGSGAYAGVSFEAGRMDKNFNLAGPRGTLYSTALFVGADTFLGPAWAGIGVAPGGHRAIFLTIGVP